MNQSQIEILLTARNQAQSAFAEFSKQITQVATDLLKSAEASTSASAGHQQAGQAATQSADAHGRLRDQLDQYVVKAEASGTASKATAGTHRDLGQAVTENKDAHEGLSDILGPFISKYLQARTIFELARAAYADYTAFLKSSVEAYADAEAAEVRLGAALKAQGDYSPTLVSQYEHYADELERTTTVSRTTGLQAEATFATFGNVGPAMMDRAIKAAADFSAATGKSMESASMAISKAAEGNVGALQRYGIQISKSEVDMDGMGVVFDAIEKRMGGQSEAITGTLLGSWEQLGNQWTRSKEQVGQALAPALTLGIHLLSGMNAAIAASPPMFATFVIGMTAVAGSMAWMGLADLFGDKLSRLASLIGGPLTQSVSLYATENSVAQGSVLGLSGAEAVLETETVGVTGSILGLSEATTVAAAAETVATGSTLALASAAGIATLAMGGLVVLPLAWMVGEWIGKVTGLTDAIQHLAGASGNAALKAEEQGAKQDTVNSAIAKGAPSTVTYAEALKYLDNWNQKLVGSTEASTQASKRFNQQVDALVESVLKAGNAGDEMNAAFTMLNDHGLANSVDAVNKLWPQVDKLVKSGADLAPEVLSWYHAWKTFMSAEAETKKFDSAVTAMTDKLKGDTGPTVKVVTAAFKGLSDTQRESGDTVTALTPIIQKFLDKGVALPPLLRDWANAHDVVSKAEAKHRQAIDEINGVMASYGSVIDTVDGSIVDWAEHLLASGVSAKTVGEYYGLTADQVKALSAAVKEDAAAEQYLTKLHDDATVAWAKSTQTSLAAQIAGYASSLEAQKAALDAEQARDEDAAKKKKLTVEQLNQALADIDDKYNALRAQKANEWEVKKQNDLATLQLEYAKAEDSLVGQTLEVKLAANQRELQDKLRIIDQQKNGDQDLKDWTIRVYQSRAAGIIAANDPIAKAWQGLNVDLRQAWADTWTQALTTQTGFLNALLDPWKQMERQWLKVLGAMAADWEAQFLQKLGFSVPGMPGGATTTAPGMPAGSATTTGGGGYGNLFRMFGGGGSPQGAYDENGQWVDYQGSGGNQQGVTATSWGKYSGYAAVGGAALSAIPTSDPNNPDQVATAGGYAKVGAQYGMVAGPLGMAAGAAIGAIVGSMKDHRAKDELATIGSSWGVEISEKLALAMQDEIDSGTFKGEVAAAIGHLGDIIKVAGGLNDSNIGMFEGRLRDTFVMIGSHQMTLAQGTKVLDENWQQFATAGTSALGVLDSKLVDIIKLNDQFGTQSKAISAYLSQQATAVQAGFGGAATVTANAYNKLAADQTALATATGTQLAALTADIKTQQGIIDATTLHSQAAATAMGAGIAAVFAQDIASGKSSLQAVLDIDPAVNSLDAVLTKTGFTGGAAFDAIKGEAALAHDAIAGPALTAVTDLASGMVALGNMGKLDQTTFAGLGSQITDTFNSLVKQGKDGGQVMVAMQGPLQQLWEEEHNFGLNLDDNTQALVDEAEKAGLVGEKHKSSTDQMIDALGTLHKDLTGIVGVLTGGPGSVAGAFEDLGKRAKDAITKIPTNYDLTLNINPKVKSPDSENNPDNYAAMGGFVTTTGVLYAAQGFPGAPSGTDTIPAWLTPGEAVLNRGAVSRLGHDTVGALNRGGAPFDASAIRDMHAEIAGLRRDMKLQADTHERALQILPMMMQHALRGAR